MNTPIERVNASFLRYSSQAIIQPRVSTELEYVYQSWSTDRSGFVWYDITIAIDSEANLTDKCTEVPRMFYHAESEDSMSRLKSE